MEIIQFMLPRGSIAKVYEYYFTAPHYKDEVLRAMREFFDRPDLNRGDYLETNEKSEGLFNEWFLYDFVLANGRTVLADFVAENPLKLSATEMVLYKNLSETNVYGVYEVVDVDIDEGLRLENLQTKEEIYVRECKLTSQIKPGNVFFGRVGKVEDHHELVGADTFSLAGLDASLKKYLREKKFRITPKIAHDIWKRR